MSDELQDLIEQLAYLDHEHGTDVAGDLASAIADIKLGGLTEDEAKELLEDRVELMKLNSVLQNDEQLRYVEAFIRHALTALFA